MAESGVLKGMTMAVPIIPPDFNVGQTQKYLNDNIKKLETINYIYVADDKNRLVGVFSIKELYKHSQNTQVKKICCLGPLVTISSKENEVRAVYLAIKHGIKAVPVVDKGKKFVGVVPNDQIIKILYRDLREDLLHIAGIHRSHADMDDIIAIPLMRAVKHRIPWLLIGLIGGLVAAGIVGSFEETLEQNIILASFIPLVVYIADSVRTQLEAFTIRDITLYKKLDMKKYFGKQMAIIIITAAILSITIMVAGTILNYADGVSMVLGAAIFTAITSSVVTGIGIPFLFRQFRIDPANASGPIGTILQDILSVFIYFTIATFILHS